MEISAIFENTFGLTPTHKINPRHILGLRSPLKAPLKGGYRMSYYKPYNDFALIVVLFILLVIVGTAYIKW